MRMKEIFTKHGYPLFIDSYTNQQFVILDNRELERLSREVKFSFWEKYDEEHTVVRFATSFATTMADIDALEALLAD